MIGLGEAGLGWNGLARVVTESCRLSPTHLGMLAAQKAS